MNPTDIAAGVSDFVLADGYARFAPSLGRLESFGEVIERVEALHLAHYRHLTAPARREVREAFDRVREKRLLPAMRSLRYGGEPILRHQARLYNTWAAPCDYPRVFAEAFYLLACGSGIGFSVQRHHVARLPRVASRLDARRALRVEDSIEGWSAALDLLTRGLFEGFDVDFDTADIRPAGTPLETAGGTAPGPEPLHELAARFRRVFAAARGRRLRPIECYDLFCFVAEAAMIGGSGRSALLAVFSPEDGEMMRAKSGDWYATHAWRRHANHSAALLRGRADRRRFRELFRHAREWGDPGVFWVDDLEVCSNSCVEVGFYPRLTVTRSMLPRLRRRHPEVRSGDVLSGFQGGTLCEINGAAVHSRDDFLEVARAAALINTLQAGYTSFPFLGPVSELLTQRDALLGVGITGMLENGELVLDPAHQRRAAAEVLRTNERWSRILGIRPAARTTLVKPAGKTSLIFGGVGAGIHPRHAERYFLRLSPRPGSRVFERFREANPQMCTDVSERAKLAVFPLAAGQSSRLRHELTALEHLDLIHSTLENWVRPGDRRRNPARHNVSNTVTVREGEWEEVERFVWRHQDLLSGVALLSDQGELKHPHAPYQGVVDEEGDAAWRHLVAAYDPVDYSRVET